jgi:hypothetical protein
MASYFRPLLPFMLVWGVLLLSNSFAQMGLVNGLTQLVLFGLVVCLPLWRTGRLSYVDIGWPWRRFSGSNRAAFPAGLLDC